MISSSATRHGSTYSVRAAACDSHPERRGEILVRLDRRLCNPCTVCCGLRADLACGRRVRLGWKRRGRQRHCPRCQRYEDPEGLAVEISGDAVRDQRRRQGPGRSHRLEALS